MIRIILMDGSPLEIPREEALELIPFRHVFRSALLKTPLEGLLPHRGKLLPLVGVMPSAEDLAKPVEQRPWIFLLKEYAIVVKGLPTFEEGFVDNVVELNRAKELAPRDIPPDRIHTGRGKLPA